MGDFLQQLVNGGTQGAIYALIAVGYTMVYGVLSFINFAHGDVFMVGAVSGLVAGNIYLTRGGQPSLAVFFLVLVIAMIVCALVGMAIERLAYRPLRSRPRLTVLITAIGVSMLLEYGFQHPRVFGATNRPFPPVLPWADQTLSAWGVTFSAVDILIVSLTLVLMVALSLLVKFTRVGMAMRAVAYRADTAALMGVPVDRIISLTFAIGSAMAAAAGVLWAAKYPQVGPFMGLMPGLKAFVAAVLGGIGSIYGAALGGLLLGIVEVMVAGYIPSGSQYRDGVAFLILIAVLLVRPAGLLGRSGHEKV
jgi:branched-chain amino acid transport system permease protein